MPTTVRVEDDVKAHLDRFQGLFQSETGQRLSQSQLLARLLRFAERRAPDFFNDVDTPWHPPTEEQLDRFFAQLGDWGATDAARIDEELYGPRDEDA